MGDEPRYTKLNARHHDFLSGAEACLVAPLHIRRPEYVPPDRRRWSFSTVVDGEITFFTVEAYAQSTGSSGQLILLFREVYVEDESQTRFVLVTAPFMHPVGIGGVFVGPSSEDPNQVLAAIWAIA
jgi:hypothetical protein